MLLSYLSSTAFPYNPHLAMLDSAPLCSKPAPKLDVHFKTLLTGDGGDIIVNAAALIVQSNAAKEGLRRRLLH